MKRFLAALKELFQLGAQPKMSQEWAQNEMSQYEDADRKAAGINL